MMKKFLYSIFALTFAGLAGCQESGDFGEPAYGGKTGGSASFEMMISSPWTPVNTYAPVVPVAGENDIYTLHLVFFERTATGTGAYKGFYSVDIPDGKPLNMNNPVPVDFEEAGLSDRQAYNIYLVANLDYYMSDTEFTDWKNGLPVLTEKEAIEQTDAFVSGQPDQTVYAGGHKPLLMSTVTVKEVNEGRIEVILARTVARFDITSHVKYDYDLVSASIWNAFPYTPVWERTIDYDAPGRVERYYGIKNKPAAGDPDGVYEDMFGGLYCFENTVASPLPKDKKTTCMIVGLRNRDTSAPDYGKTMYYRINILSSQNGQNLKRNNTYQITLRNVNETGYNTEREAYEGEANRLEFVINYWDLDDDGIIQYDGDNVLAVPMKRINIPREGDEREYSIFTIGQGSLAISRNTVPAGIEVTLKGNRLYVDSAPLDKTQTERKGEIDLTFGALKATVIIRQSGEVGEFLTVTPTELPSFPAYAASQSGAISVSASGEWKAAIFNPGFTFRMGSDVREITSAHGDSFTVSTTGSNEANTTRFAFVKVSLADNPEITRTIVLKQQARSSLTLTPAQNYIIFNPDGTVMSGSNNVFGVNPGDDGETTPTVNKWGVVLGNTAYFEAADIVYDPGNINNNMFTVRAKGVNTGTSDYSTTVKVFLTANPSISQTMTVMQQPYNFSVSPKVFNPIPAAGGVTPAITVSGFSGATWSATVTTNTAGHEARLYTNHSSSQVGSLNNIPMGHLLYVMFPALNKPGVSPVATVTIRLDGTNISETFTVTQTMLVGRPLSFHSFNTSEFTMMHGYSGYNYMKAYGENLKNWKYFGKEEQSVVKTTGGIGFTSGKTIASGTTNYHANEGCATSVRDKIIQWMNSDSRNFLTVCTDNLISDQEATLKRFSSAYKLQYATIKSTVRHTLSNTPQQYRTSKVWEYLTKTGPFTNGAELDPNNVSLYNCGGICGKVVAITAWPSTAYPVLMNPNNTAQALIVVDPVNRLIAIGSGEIFSYKNTYNNFAEGTDNWKFLNNLLAFTVNAGQYGNTFLDGFR